MVEYDDWVADIVHRDFEDRATSRANSPEAKFLLKNRIEGASEVYKRAREKWGRIPSSWGEDIALLVRGKRLDDEQVKYYFPDLPTPPSPDSYAKRQV